MKLKKGITKEIVENEIKSIESPWYHIFKFGDMIAGRAEIIPAQEWRVSMLPKDYTGKSVLDIGGLEGFYSFDAEDRGAVKVVCMDFMPNAKRKLALKLYDSIVEELLLDVYDMDTIKDQFDVIIFMGVLYHLKHPLIGLEKVYNRLVDGGELYLETLITTTGIPQDQPFVEFIEGTKYNNDNTNWWAPTREATLGMMRSCGFKECKYLSGFSTSRGFFHAVK